METIAIFVIAFIVYRMVDVYLDLRKIAVLARFQPESVPILINTSTMMFISGMAFILSIGI